MLLIQRGGGTDPMKPQQPSQAGNQIVVKMVLISAEVKDLFLEWAFDKARFLERRLLKDERSGVHTNEQNERLFYTFRRGVFLFGNVSSL
jgi:hypothetical protein